MQFIAPDGTKDYLTGSRVSGCFHMIGGEPNGALYVAEGYATAASIFEATGIATAVGLSSGNLPPVAKSLRAKFPDARIVICADDGARTPDNPGLRDGRKAAQGIGAFLAVPDFGQNRPDRGSDFNDLCQVAGPEAVRVCIARAALFERPEAEAETDAQPNGPADEGEANGLDEEIARLAALREADYLSQRREAANRLGWPVSALDRLVAAARPADENTPAKGRRLELPEPVQWPEPVDGTALVAELKAAIRKYVVLTENDALTIALWVLYTYCFDAFPCTPRLAITAPEKRCGKTTLLDVIGLLSRAHYRRRTFPLRRPSGLLRQCGQRC